jgi:hypothetical protein
MKTKFLLLFLLVGITLTSHAQSDTTQFKPEKYPAFKGGVNAWTSFLEMSLDRNLMEKNGAPEGSHTTLASFIVDADGTVLDIKIEKDPGYGAADEMIRILKKSSKKWEPAVYNGRPIAFRTKQSLTLIR